MIPLYLSLFLSLNCTIILGLMLLLTMVVPKGVAVIILAWIGTISCSIAFGAGYTYTKVSLVLSQ